MSNQAVGDSYTVVSLAINTESPSEQVTHDFMHECTDGETLIQLSHQKPY